MSYFSANERVEGGDDRLEGVDVAFGMAKMETKRLVLVDWFDFFIIRSSLRF